MKSSCGKVAFTEFWFRLTIPLQMGWLRGLCRLLSAQWSHQLMVPQALYRDAFRISFYLTGAYHTLLPAHLPPSYSYSKNFAHDCLWLHPRVASQHGKMKSNHDNLPNIERYLWATVLSHVTTYRNRGGKLVLSYSKHHLLPFKSS